MESTLHMGDRVEVYSCGSHSAANLTSGQPWIGSDVPVVVEVNFPLWSISESVSVKLHAFSTLTLYEG
jgi:hypothetical protein